MSDDNGNLFIRMNTTDNGNRSDPNAVFWESPSVWLSTTAGAGQFDANTINTIKAGKPGFINIIVDSLSDNPVDGVVAQGWVADPGGGPQATQPSNRVPGPNPADTFPESGGVTVTKSNPQLISIPWTTFEDTSNSLGDLHRCVATNVFAVSSIGVPTEGINVNGAPGNPFSPLTRQKQAQRNITLKPAAANGGRARFLFNVPNFGVEGAEYTLTVEEVRGEDGFDQIGQEHVLGLRVATVTGLDPVAIQQLRQSDFCHQLGRPLERALLEAGGRPVIVDSRAGYEVVAARRRARQAKFSSASIKEGCHEGGEDKGGRDREDATVFVPTGAVVPVALDVTVADDTQFGAVHTFQVKQWDEDGNVVGGQRFIVLGSTDELLNPCRYMGNNT